MTRHEASTGPARTIAPRDRAAADQPGSPRRPAVLEQHAAVFLLFAALSILWSYPLVAHLGTHIPGGPGGDAATFVWNNWWMRTAVASGRDPFWTPLLFAPYGTSLVLHTHTALPSLVGATLLDPLPLVPATNVILLAALALNGFCAYLLAHALTRRGAASIVAGIIYGGSPFVTTHLLGHFNLVHVWVIPLVAWCAWHARCAGSVRWAAATALSVAAAIYTDYYLALYAIALVAIVGVLDRLTVAHPSAAVSSRPGPANALAIVALLAATGAAAIAVTGGTVLDVGGVRIIARRPTNLVTVAWIAALLSLAIRRGPRLRAIAWRDPVASPTRPRRTLAWAVPLVVLAPLVASALTLWRSGAYISPTYLWRSSPSGIDVLTLVLGNPLHPVTGGWTRDAYARFGIDPIESGAWLGAAAVMVLLLGRHWRASAAGRRLAMTGAAFFVAALGPWLMVAGMQTGILLPGFVLRAIPIVNNARMPGRAMVVVYLVAALLVAIGLARGTRGRMLPLLLGAVVAVDYAAMPLPLGRIDVSSIYGTLTESPGAVLELPIGFRDGFGESGRFDSQILLNQTVHGRPIVGGFVGRLAPSIADQYSSNPLLHSLLAASTGTSIAAERMAADAAIAGRALAALGVTQIVIDRAAAPPSLIEYATRVLPIGEPAARDGRREVYRVGR